MNSRSRLYWLIPPLAILGFLFGCFLGFVIPEKEEVPETVPTTTVATEATSEPTTLPTLSAEEQMIADFIDSVEGYVEPKRADLDGDGVEELLLYRNGSLNEIAAVTTDSVVSLMKAPELFLCENGFIGRYGEGAGGHTGMFYQLIDGQFWEVERLVYVWEQGVWYSSPDLTGNYATLVPITEAERQAILAKYPCAEPVDGSYGRLFIQLIYE